MFDEDLTIFFDEDDFAVTATLLFADGTRSTIRCVYDDPYLNADLGEYVLDTSEPRITARSKDVARLRWKADHVLVNGETFNVVAMPQHDGTGLAVVKLARPVNQ